MGYIVRLGDQVHKVTSLQGILSLIEDIDDGVSISIKRDVNDGLELDGQIITFLRQVDKGITPHDFYYKEECTRKDICQVVQITMRVGIVGRDLTLSLYHERPHADPHTMRSFFRVGTKGGDWFLRHDEGEGHTQSSSWGDSRTVNDIIKLCNLEPPDRFTNLITYVDKWMRDRASLLCQGIVQLEGCTNG